MATSPRPPTTTLETSPRPAGAPPPRCPLCGEAMGPWLEVPRDGCRPADTGPYHVHWCDACRFGAVLPRPTPEALAAAYQVDGYYTHGTATSSRHGPGARLLERLLVALAWRADRGVTLTADEVVRWAPAGGRVVDLGCGNAWLLAGAKERGLSVVGVEPDPAARETARSRGVPVLEGTAERLPDALPRGGFDVVVLSHSLEHCLDPVLAMRNARSLLRPGGVALVEVPNNEAVGLRAAGAAWPWFDVPRHLSFFTGTSLRGLCRRVGLEPLAVDHVGYARQFWPGWLSRQAAIAAALGLPRPPSAARLLARTLLARPEEKYDSVRVVARLPA